MAKKILSTRQIAAISKAQKASIGVIKQNARVRRLKVDNVRKIVQQQVMLVAHDLIHSALIVAKGGQYVYKVVKERNEKGSIISRRNVQIREPDEIAHALDVIHGYVDPSGEEDQDTFYILTDKPDFRAIDGLLDRGIGKVEDRVKVDGNVKHTHTLISLGKSREMLPEHLKAEPFMLPARVVDVSK